MKLSRPISVFLLAVGVWNVVTFLDFARRLVADTGRPTGFYVAHTTLIVVNIAIGVALIVIGYRGWRAARG
ncbi:MAG: hypothetical protein GEV11_17325 [Streptosporangiales bacterium]|nr:hypothetical protein [Streptosporangiales bacterium]